MASESPISEGFRRAWHGPEIVLAEIAWRWSFGVATLALGIGSLWIYLDTLPVSNSAFQALGRHPRWLVASALAHVLHDGAHLLRFAAIMLPAIFVLWIAAVTLGRAATLTELLGREAGVRLRPQLGLSFLRASVALASFAGCLGALILAGQAAADTRLSSGVALAIFALLTLTIEVLRSRLNWFLSLAAIPAARNGCDTLAAISTAVALFRRQSRKFAGAGTVFGAIHGVIFAFATVVSLLVLALADKVPPAATLFFLTAITLAYCAAVDFLHIARLAAYVAIDEIDRTPPPPATVAVAPESLPPAPEPPMPIPEPLVET